MPSQSRFSPKPPIAISMAPAPKYYRFSKSSDTYKEDSQGIYDKRGNIIRHRKNSTVKYVPADDGRYDRFGNKIPAKESVSKVSPGPSAPIPIPTSISPSDPIPDDERTSWYTFNDKRKLVEDPDGDLDNKGKFVRYIRDESDELVLDPQGQGHYTRHGKRIYADGSTSKRHITPDTSCSGSDSQGKSSPECIFDMSLDDKKGKRRERSAGPAKKRVRRRSRSTSQARASRGGGNGA